MKNKALNIHVKTIYSSLILFCVIICCQQYANAQSPDDYKIIKDANKAYADGKFQEAAELYEKIVAKEFTSAELNFNLGNAYYRLSDYKRAILYYERAKLLNPDDDDISINLGFAQRFVQDKIESVPKFILIRWGNNFINWFSVQTWSVLSIIMFILVLILVTLFLFSKKVILRKLSVYIGFLALIVSLLSFYCAYRQNKKISSHSTAIIFSPAVTVKSSPDKNGTDLFIIHEGLKVNIIGASEGWKEIKLSDGKIGWLPDEAIEKI